MRLKLCFIFVIFVSCHHESVFGASHFQPKFSKFGEFNGLAFKGVQILQNSKEHPMISVGKGTFQANDLHGNFFIEDHVNELVGFSDIIVDQGKCNTIFKWKNRDLLHLFNF